MGRMKLIQVKTELNSKNIYPINKKINQKYLLHFFSLLKYPTNFTEQTPLFSNFCTSRSRSKSSPVVSIVPLVRHSYYTKYKSYVYD
jgi:hypothetical protein